jgi:hypothetical protein
MLGLAKRAKEAAAALPEPVERKLSLTNSEPPLPGESCPSQQSHGDLLVAQPVIAHAVVEKSVSKLFETTPSPTPLQTLSPVLETTPTKSSAPLIASPDATPEPKKGKVEAAGSLAHMFAQRAAPAQEAASSPPEASSSRGGGPSRGAALAGLFAGRGADSSPAGRGGRGIGGSGASGRGAGLAGLFAGRGAGGPPSGAAPQMSSNGMTVAVTSSRPIPIPPYLPGQTPQASGAPGLPGQQPAQSRKRPLL